MVDGATLPPLNCGTGDLEGGGVGEGDDSGSVETLGGGGAHHSSRGWWRPGLGRRHVVEGIKRWAREGRGRGGDEGCFMGWLGLGFSRLWADCLLWLWPIDDLIFSFFSLIYV